MLKLPVTSRATFVLVRPHYPENLGAAARAIKTMGITELVVVKPSRLAVPEHEMARKMAVKSRDVLEGARVVPHLDDALGAIDLVFTTTARRGVSGVVPPRRAAAIATSRDCPFAVVFGNEKSGLSTDDLERGDEKIRIPMAADQPSINLAQAVQIVAYELFVAGLEERAERAERGTPERGISSEGPESQRR